MHKLIYIIKGVMFVCLSVSMFRMAGQTAGPIETKLDTLSCPPRECFCQGQCHGHSCMRAGVTELRNTRKATPGERCSNYLRRTGEATPGERLQNSGRREITARVTRRGAEQRAPKARVELRPEDGLQLVSNKEIKAWRGRSLVDRVVTVR